MPPTNFLISFWPNGMYDAMYQTSAALRVPRTHAKHTRTPSGVERAKPRPRAERMTAAARAAVRVPLTTG
eukprot:446298-Prymnesium_polylepis.1